MTIPYFNVLDRTFCILNFLAVSLLQPKRFEQVIVLPLLLRRDNDKMVFYDDQVIVGH